MDNATVRKKYSEFLLSHNGLLPKVVTVEIKWKDTAETLDCIMSLDQEWVDDNFIPFRFTELGCLKEDKIFYHLGNIEWLYVLLENSVEDFLIVCVYDFY